MTFAFRRLSETRYINIVPELEPEIDHFADPIGGNLLFAEEGSLENQNGLNGT
jgi:hypothetical protein